MSKFAFFLAFVGLWAVAWFVWIRPFLKTYRLTMGLMDDLEAAELTAWKRFKLSMRGLWGFALLSFDTFFATAHKFCSDAFDTLSNLQPQMLEPFKDTTIWKTLFSAATADTFMAVLGLASMFLVLKGQVFAASATPKPKE